MYKNIKTLVKLYYQWMWARRSEEQISWDLTSVAQSSCTTACDSTAALLQTGTSTHVLVGMLFERTLLVRWAWAVTEQNDRAERHAVQWWRMRERGNLDTAGRCGNTYFRLPKIQCIPSKWTNRFFEACNLPRLFFVFELLEESFQPY